MPSANRDMSTHHIVKNLAMKPGKCQLAEKK